MSNEPPDLVHQRLARAREALASARVLADTQHWSACTNRLYYACFYAVSALLARHNLEARTHNGVRRLFGQHFVQTGTVDPEWGRFYAEVFQYRQLSDYDDYFEPDPDLVRAWLERADRLIALLETLAT